MNKNIYNNVDRILPNWLFRKNQITMIVMNESFRHSSRFDVHNNVLVHKTATNAFINCVNFGLSGDYVDVFSVDEHNVQRYFWSDTTNHLSIRISSFLIEQTPKANFFYF